MEFDETSIEDGIARIELRRGKVNAIVPAVVFELRERLTEIERSSAVRAVVITGRGKFFSFGFDIPAFLSYSKTEFKRFLHEFTALYRDMFLFPKPVVAAINGHAIAGGCMLALACDVRIMVGGSAKISLNEITFGSSVFAGSTEMLELAVGPSRACEVLYSGAMFDAENAARIGLVHEVVDSARLLARADELARQLPGKNPSAFSSIKRLLRAPVAERMERREELSIDEFIEIWYSAPTRAELETITIRE